MKLILTISASEWTKENANAFLEWLDKEILESNMGTGDDACITDYKVEE
jgi:hypothetical protein